MNALFAQARAWWLWAALVAAVNLRRQPRRLGLTFTSDEDKVISRP